MMQNQWQILEESIQKHHFKRAEASLKRIFERNLSDTEQTQALIFRARVRLLSGRPDDAIKDLEKISFQDESHTPLILELQADARLSRFELAQVGFADRQDLNRAGELYRDIIQTTPHYANLGWIYYQLGRVYLLSSQVAPAENCFHQALLHPATVQMLTAYSYERLGFLAFFESRQPQRAMTFLQKAIDTYPAHESQLWLIQVYLLKSRVLRDQDAEAALHVARQAYQIAVRHDNRVLMADVLFDMAEVSHSCRLKPEHTIEFAQSFLQIAKAPVGINVTWSRIYEMLAGAYFEQQNYERAIEAYEQVLRFNPDHPWEEHIRYQIACSHYQNQSYHSVIETIQPLLPDDEGEQISEFHNLYGILGNAYFALEQYNQAARAYHTALDTAPPGKDIQQLQDSYQLSLHSGNAG